MSAMPRDYAKYSTCINLFNYHNNSRMVLSSAFIGEAEELSSWLKVTELPGRRTRVRP